MKPFALIIPLCIGCASAPIVQQTQPSEETPEPPECPAGEFRGVGADEITALSNLAKQINLSIKVTTERAVNQQSHNGNEDLTVVYKDAALMGAELSNAHDARIVHNKRSSVVACMSKADAAKGFLERQRLIADSLGMVSNAVLNEKHPKLKNDAWSKTQTLWNKFIGIQNLLEGWGIESKHFDSASESHAKARDGYKDYCQTAKLHWNPERETLYSEIAFSKLSGSVKMEKSPCKGHGISLAYKGTEPDCSVKFGLNTCNYAQSLSVSACDGTEYLQLKSDVMGAHQKPDFALEKLQGSLKSAEFWSQWMQEIKQWSLQCE